jgi:hypothetical protein
MLAWPDAGSAVHTKATNVVAAENATSRFRVTLVRVRKLICDLVSSP